MSVKVQRDKFKVQANKLAVVVLKEMKKLTLVLALAFLMTVLAIPLNVHAAGGQSITRNFVPTANAAITVDAGDNDGFETTPANAYDDDANYAVDSSSGLNENSVATGTGTDKHNYYNYSMDTIPGTATISGITVRADIAMDSISDSPFTAIRLSWDGGTSWTTEKQQTLTAKAETTYTYGGSADNWGRTWSGSELTDTNFRLQVINGEMKAQNSNYIFSLDYIAISITFTSAWDSYSDSGRTAQTDTFDNGTNIIYMKGTDFLDGSQTYNISYYDNSGSRIATDTDIALVNVSGSRGTLGNTGSPYEPFYDLTGNKLAEAGTWHIVAQPSGATAFPSAYSTLSPDPDTYELIGDDTCTIDPSAIPEFPTIMAAIGVTGLCFAIYYWMKRRRFAGSKHTI